MDQKLKSAALDREYANIDPDILLITEEDCDALHIFLPGFTKEQLRLQLTPARTLKITGERPLTNSKWLRLQQEYPVSRNCDTSKINAKFENGILYVKQPKSVVSPAVKGEKGKPASETQKAVIEVPKPDQKSADDQPRPQKPDQKPINDQPQPQQTNDQETKSMVDQSKQKEGKKSESVNDGSVDKGDMERERGEEEGKRNGVAEDGKGKIKDTSEGQESSGWTGGRAPPVVAMWRRPMGKVINLPTKKMVINLVVGILLVLVIGIYARNWMKSLPWNMENES